MQWCQGGLQTFTVVCCFRFLVVSLSRFKFDTATLRMSKVCHVGCVALSRVSSPFAACLSDAAD